METGLTAVTEPPSGFMLVPPGRPLPMATAVACGPLPEPDMPGTPRPRLMFDTAGPLGLTGLVVLPMLTAVGCGSLLGTAAALGLPRLTILGAGGATTLTSG